MESAIASSNPTATPEKIGQVLAIRAFGPLSGERGCGVRKLPHLGRRVPCTVICCLHRSQWRASACELLFDLPDDPRGALRWSLSNLRMRLDHAAPSRIAISFSSEVVRDGPLSIAPHELA
jgi:hypothetical protein